MCDTISAQSTKVLRNIVEIEVEPQGKTYNAYGSCDPFCLAFVYSPAYREGRLLKGWLTEVKEQVKREFAKPYLANFTFWFGGQQRGYWNFELPIEAGKIYLDRPTKPSKHKPIGTSNLFRNQYNRHFIFTSYNSGEKVLLLKLRRIPRRWIPEYDKIIEQVAAMEAEKICVIKKEK